MKIQRSIQDWIEQDLKQGMGKVHAWARDKVDPYVTEYAQDGDLVTEPLQVVRAKIKGWQKYWNKEGDLPRVQWALDTVSKAAEQAEPMQPFTVPQLEAALAKTRNSCGLGSDWLEPALLKKAPKAAKQDLVNQMTGWEATGAVPAQLVCNIVKLLVKPDAGDRPITLMPMPVRLLFKMRSKETSAWGTAQQRHWDAAVRGSSALRAALAQKLMDELAPLEGFFRACVLWDLEKFYDNISLDNLVRAALQYQYPPQLLRLGLRCYLGPRLIVWRGVAAEWLAPTCSICAGCVRANDMARVVMYDVLDGMHLQDPSNQLCQFVDDVQSAHNATSALEVTDKAADAAIDFIETCTRVNLVVSGTKSCVLSRHKGVAEAIITKVKASTGRTLEHATAAKSLGLQVNSTRRRAPGRRMCAAAKRVARARLLGRSKKVAKRVFTTAAWQQVAYAAAVDGVSDSAL